MKEIYILHWASYNTFELDSGAYIYSNYEDALMAAKQLTHNRKKQLPKGTYRVDYHLPKWERIKADDGYEFIVGIKRRREQNEG